MCPDHNAEHTTPKLDRYYTGANPHILAYLPEDARRFLDVGCATGALGRAIQKARPGAVVHGIEYEPEVAERAREHLDRVYQGDLNDRLPELEGEFDCIICGDVLEHLIDPWTILRGLVAHLAPGGHVIASIPNIRYYKVLRELVFRGKFRYRESGVMDSKHLRFFTLSEMQRLFDSAGLKVSQHRPRIGGGNQLLRFLDFVTLGRLEELRAVQYTLVGDRQ